MASRPEAREGVLTISEIKEFAGFSSAAQRYVRRSLDVAYARNDALALWSRDGEEAEAIVLQQVVYMVLPTLRIDLIPASMGKGLGMFIGRMAELSAFDLGQGRLDGFAPYRFLYERLLGAAARPWLPAAFCCAAALPVIHPQRRRRLLHSISEAAATAPGWSEREPSFFPEWVEKVSV